jgi:glycine/D-amino acid oxidase-like deaminating enzyme/nitrite reductase/ring-hydroxylating ferredoxin subunit
MDVDVPAFHAAPPSETEALVIGAGITGLTTAIELARRGRQVTLIDDGPIGGGETARTSAHLASAVDDRYHVLEKKFGREGAAAVAESHTAAITYIETMVRERSIACDFRRVDGYLFAAPGASDDELDAEIAAAERAGLRCEMLAKAPIVSSGRAIRFFDQAQFHPLQYLRGLVAYACELGVAIHTGVHADAIELVKGKSRPLLVPVRGKDPIAASWVVDATNCDMSSTFQICLQQAAYRSYCVAFEPPGIEPGLYWETGDNYHYIRRTDDALIVGGEDHRVGQADEGPQFAALEAWTREHIPGAGAVVARWSGQIMEPVDGPAHIGKSPNLDNVFVCTGDSGNGLTHGTIAGMLIPRLVDGETSPWTKVYDPARSHAHAGASYLAEATRSALPYLEWIRGGDVSSTDDIAPGTGALVRRGLQICAAYRDDAGHCHVMSAVCTHLKGIVQWNPVEKSWDCPCHGSRFDAFGQVVNGPALQNLAPVETPRAAEEPVPIEPQPQRA